MTTIYEVAAHAEVSAATVSRVLNGNLNVNAIMTERVRTSIEALGYRPNQVARSLRTQRTRVVAVIVPDIENPFFTSVVRGIEDEATQEGFVTVLCNTDNHPDKERGYLRLAVDQRMDGIVLASDLSNPATFEANQDPAIATVLIDREIVGLRADIVLVDNALGAREATRHLLDSGARSVACVTGPPTVTTSMQRLDGYFQALAQAGISRRKALFRHADFRVAGGRAAVDDLLRTSKPDAFLICNNLMTMGALQVFSEQGIQLPDDVLLVGFDEEPWSGYWRPSITTVAQPARDVGRSAMRLLLERLDDADHSFRRLMLLPKLHIRESSQR